MSGRDRSFELEFHNGFHRATFLAMGSPCELLVETRDRNAADQVATIVAAEAWRVEDKFSRYLPGNIVAAINSGNGQPVTLDDETASLVDFAATLHDLSEGRFDITSGVLREVWRFDSSDNVPNARDVERVLARVGWDKVRWSNPQLTLQSGMEIDFGGIAKEYVVDRAAALAAEHTAAPCLVNFGGDLVATKPPARSGAWQVGVDTGHVGGKPLMIRLANGGLATSGDARRFLLKDGVRYSHILDPITGWPVPDAPRSVPVAADTCTQAGMLSPLAMLCGPDAESFLDDQGVRHWTSR